jgi:hypothetical protein
MTVAELQDVITGCRGIEAAMHAYRIDVMTEWGRVLREQKPCN